MPSMAEDLAQATWHRASGAGNSLYGVLAWPEAAVLLEIVVRPQYLIVTEYPQGSTELGPDYTIWEGQLPNSYEPWNLWQSDECCAERSIHRHRVSRTERAIAAYAQGWFQNQQDILDEATELSTTLYTKSSCKLILNTGMTGELATLALVANLGPTPVRRSYDSGSTQKTPCDSASRAAAQPRPLTVTLVQTRLCQLLTCACSYYETIPLGDILEDRIHH